MKPTTFILSALVLTLATAAPHPLRQSPLIFDGKIAELVNLNIRGPDLRVVVPENLIKKVPAGNKVDQILDGDIGLKPGNIKGGGGGDVAVVGGTGEIRSVGTVSIIFFNSSIISSIAHLGWSSFHKQAANNQNAYY